LHHLINRDARPRPGERRTLGSDVAAHTRSGLPVLDDTEDNNGAENSRSGEA
jgi:hypothetical protein